MGRAPDARPQLLDEWELNWASLDVCFLLPHALTHAIKYLRALLSSEDTTTWQRLSKKISAHAVIDHLVAPRWRIMFEPDWDALPDKPSP